MKKMKTTNKRTPYTDWLKARMCCKHIGFSNMSIRREHGHKNSITACGRDIDFRDYDARNDSAPRCRYKTCPGINKFT